MSATATNNKSSQDTALPTTVGAHLTKKQRKEQFDALNALQTQLDVSVSLARNKVTSWLNVDAFSDDEDSSNSSGGFAAATTVKPRQAGLGLGAKFISHKDQMRHVPINAFESKLKRQLTGGIVHAEIQRAEAAEKNALPDKYQEHKLMMAARRKELQEQAEDEEDSRTRNIGGSGASSSNKKSAVAASTGRIPTAHHNGSNSGNHKNTKVGSGAAVSFPLAAGSRGVVESTTDAQGKKETKYQAAVHPAALKAAPSEQYAVRPSGVGSASISVSNNKKRPADFFSMYMDERASKLAKKKKKNQAKVDPDDDD